VRKKRKPKPSMAQFISVRLSLLRIGSRDFCLKKLKKKKPNPLQQMAVAVKVKLQKRQNKK